MQFQRKNEKVSMDCYHNFAKLRKKNVAVRMSEAYFAFFVTKNENSWNVYVLS